MYPVSKVVEDLDIERWTGRVQVKYIDRRKGKGLFAKEKIALAPNNPSAWNYLRGALEHTNTPFATVAAFVEPYTASETPAPEVVDLDNPLPSPGAQLPCVAALEFLADTYEKEGGEKTAKAVEVCGCLSC